MFKTIKKIEKLFCLAKTKIDKKTIFFPNPSGGWASKCTCQCSTVKWTGNK